MSDILKLRTAIRQLIRLEMFQSFHYCTVSEIDESEEYCKATPLDENEAPISEIKLRLDKGKGGLIKPKDGSLVLVGMLDEHTGVILLYSEVDEVAILAEKLLTIKTAEESLKKIVSDLIDAIGVMTVPTPAGVSSPPVNKSQFDAIKTRLDKLFKE